MKDVDYTTQTKTNVNIFSSVGGKIIILFPIFIFMSWNGVNKIRPDLK